MGPVVEYKGPAGGHALFDIELHNSTIDLIDCFVRFPDLENLLG
jgi:hypothetical protein